MGSNTKSGWILSFVSEPWDALAARFAKSLERLWDGAVIAEEAARHGEQYVRPGNTRANVFDCPNGIRFIVSRETQAAFPVVIQISASVFSEHARTLVAKTKAIRGDADRSRFVLSEMRKTFRRISGGHELHMPPTFTSDGGVPHWLIIPKEGELPCNTESAKLS